MTQNEISKPVRMTRARRIGLGLIAAAGLFATATPAMAQGPNCTREDLQGIVNAYVAAQTAGEPLKLPLADWTQYSEQMEVGTLFGGIISKPQKIDFHRSVLDVPSCSTFTELVVANPEHPYVIGVRLQFSGRNNPIAPSRVNDLETIVTDKDDWLFNAKKTLAYSKAENWDTIPEGDRDTRETLTKAATAYLDSFNDKTVVVPWGTPCARLEGGLYSAKGAPGVVSAEDTCNVGVPSGVKLTDRRFIIDETIGAVSVLLLFGANQLPDVHTFRIEKGKIRYVHTMTVCKAENCGLQLPEEVKQRLKD